MGLMQGREEHRGKGVREGGSRGMEGRRVGGKVGGREEALSHHSSVSIAYHTL